MASALTGGKLIVVDEDYTHASSVLKQSCDELIACLDDFTACVGVIIARAIQDQQISERLTALRSSAFSLRPTLQTASDELSSCSANFASDIGTADNYSQKWKV